MFQKPAKYFGVKVLKTTIALVCTNIVSILTMSWSTLVHLLFLISIRRNPVSSFELQTLVSKLVISFPDHFVFYFFGLEHLYPKSDKNLASNFAYCDESISPCPQQITFSGPLTTGKDPTNILGSIVIQRGSIKLSPQRFDIIVTPTCTPFYTPSSENVEPYATNLNSEPFGGWSLVDDYGFLKSTSLFSFPSTLFVIIKNCGSERYRRIALRSEPFIPVILELQSTTLVDYSNMKVVTMRKDFPFGESNII